MHVGARGRARAEAELCATGALTDSGAGCTGHAPGHDCHHARGVEEALTALLNEKDAKVVAERLSKMAGPVTLAMLTQELGCPNAEPTRPRADMYAAAGAQ